MLMYASVCKAVGNSDANVAKFITHGFTGCLKGWWDHYLTMNQHYKILDTFKIIERNRNIDVIMEHQEDVVYTVSQTILNHFMGEFLDRNEKSRELVHNLRCLSLTHFR